MALINHTNVSLTLLHLSWQNPVLPASQRFVHYYVESNKLLGVILLSLDPFELWTTYTGPSCGTFGRGTRHWGANVSFHWTKAPSLEICLRQWQVSQLVPSPGNWQPNRSEMNSSPHKDRLGLWGCRTCFWVKSSFPPIYMFIQMKRVCVCVLWVEEIMVMFWVESDVVSYCFQLTNSIHLKYDRQEAVATFYTMLPCLEAGVLFNWVVCFFFISSFSPVCERFLEGF